MREQDDNFWKRGTDDDKDVLWRRGTDDKRKSWGCLIAVGLFCLIMIAINLIWF